MLEKIEELTTTFTSTFLTKEDGQLDINHTLVPHLAEAVDQSLRDALAQKQVSMRQIMYDQTFCGIYSSQFLLVPTGYSWKNKKSIIWATG